MTLLYYTTDQVLVWLICVNVCRSYVPFATKNTQNTVFRTFLLHALTYWTEIVPMTLCYCTTMYRLRSSFSFVNLRQLLWELCHFWYLEYWKYTVFRLFLLYALTYWADILHMTLLYYTTDQVPFATKNTENTVFRTFLLHALTYWTEILPMTLCYCTTMYRSRSNFVNLRQFLWELCPFWYLEYWKYTVFRLFLLHALTYWAKFCIWLCFTVLQIKFVNLYQFL